MTPGNYLEYACAKCGFCSSIMLNGNKEHDKHCETILTEKVKSHIIKCPDTRDIFSSKLAKDFII